MKKIRLTEFSHGGGCGCKIAPAVLSRLLAESPLRTLPADLLVGVETADDAAVYRFNDTQAVVATTDFFTPIVDDPFDFGRIAATNALSDVYAMGGTPIFALAIVGMPLDKLPEEVIRQILAGGESVCAAAGIPIAGGHSIDVLEPIYGLVGIGIVHPAHLKKNAGAKDGDVLILGKPLGIGILSGALKKGLLTEAGYAEMLRWTTKLNTVGPHLAKMPGVRAVTDVTGFGLAGHLLEMCRGSHLAAQVEFDRLPLIEEAVTHVRAGIATGASSRNWSSYGPSVQLAPALEEWQQKVMTDPQTSGGLLVACAPESVAAVLAAFHADGFAPAAVIGVLQAGEPLLNVV
ncbi:MAG: selenide, water dikinase SelD [Gammaproteobacteria bacterium]|nr:selenide, water dikinase SelD [Rhodocyclaceae bacterium]MBU3908494.1 selenide, water dikinase SelD [Gammaproteobacteria bacterium]MBU3988623.1 selenide, water dikinase SelD [Gammaproteobacteria bacterium]MBU4004522.1 selenide, water dikinase SelD [Gammaproteobacteria bacterium]MBU4021125.1 selenide, water dikinase SelD [Gammaproteobacteria bacterium]